jgi:hypothetical protein
VGPTACLDIVAKRKVLHCWQSNHGRPARSLVTILTELSRLCILLFNAEVTQVSLSRKFSETEINYISVLSQSRMQ